MMEANINMTSAIAQNQAQLQSLMKTMAESFQGTMGATQQALAGAADSAATAAAAAAALGANQAPSPPVIVQGAPKQKIPKEVNVALEKAKTRYETDLRKWISAQRRYHKLEDELKMFDEGEGRYPAGVKPFAASETLAELDLPNDEVIASSSQITIQIKQGSTFREAMASIHWSCFRRIKYLEKRSAEKKMSDAKQAALKVTFANTVTDIIKAAAEKDRASAL